MDAHALIGRDAELAWIAGELGSARPVVVSGEAGIGKTTLLAAAAAATGRRSRTGGALDLLSFVPYLALGRAVGDVGDGEPTEVARRLLARCAADILVLDDLQWADERTLVVIELLAGRIAMLVGVRTGDGQATDVLARLHEAGFRERRLPPLTAADGVILAQRARAGLNPALARQVVADAAGNPLLIVELARSGVTSSLRLAVAHRIRQLDEAARVDLELLAVARGPVSMHADGTAIARLVDAGLATHDGVHAQVRHALIADAVADALDDATMRARHRAVAALVDDPAEQARHLALAGDHAAAARVAREAAASSLPGRRAALLGLAAENTDGPDAARVRVEAAEALEAARLDVEAERIVADLPPSGDELEARIRSVLGRTRWRLGDADGARTELTRGLRIVEGTSSAREVDLLTQTAWLSVVERDAATGLRLATRAIAVAREIGASAARATRTVAVARMIAGEPETAFMPLFEEALVEARAHDDVVAELSTARNIIGWSEGSGRFEEGLTRGWAFVERAREAGFTNFDHDLRASLITLLNSAGDYPRVVAETESLLLEPIDARTRAEISGYCALALIDLGRFDDARSLIATELERSVDDIGGRFDLLWAQAELALAEGNARLAAEVSQHCIERFGGRDYPDLVFVRLIHAWAALELDGDPDPAIPRSRRGADLWTGAAPESAGIRALVRGNAELAARRFEEAAGLFARFHRRSELRTRWAHGEALRRAGRTDDALAVLGAAEARADELGMAAILGRIRRSLRLAGARRAAPRAAAGRLTAREREILGLVAGGLTNREIAARLGLGRPTVVRTIANASAKLGATSRRQAALEALDLV